jgi:DNA-binding NtrC family response regulator
MAKKILLVEDDKMLCTIFQMFIQELGYEIVETVRSGEDAIKAMECNPNVDCIIMDIQLDGKLDGIETATILGKSIKTPIIFITGCTAPDIIQRATLPNVFGFMIKPLYKQNLGVSIEYACAKKALHNNQNTKH